MRISDWSSDVCSSDLQRHAFMFTRGALKQLNTCFGNGTAVEETCQRIGRRQKTCALLGLLALLHFYLKVAVTSPAKENKRDVKQQGRHHDLLDASAKPGQAPDHGGHSRTAGPDKHNDCGNDDAACDHISTSGLHVRNISLPAHIYVIAAPRPD